MGSPHRAFRIPSSALPTFHTMTPAFDAAHRLLKQLPGLGHRSAERVALHLLVEKPAKLAPLLDALRAAAEALQSCPECGNLCEGERCAICADPRRDASVVCVVEQVPDLLAIERAGAYAGRYHVLHGRLSPIRGVGPEDLHLDPLERKFAAGEVRELILALPNAIEGEATCHYLTQTFAESRPDLAVSRIGFGLPSGGALTFADPATLRSALDGRRGFNR